MLDCGRAPQWIAGLTVFFDHADERRRYVCAGVPRLVSDPDPRLSLALFRGNATYAATQATSYRMGVSTRVTVTSPANGSTTRAGTPLAVRGGTSPNKSGSLITLYRFSGGRYVAVQNARVASNGTYVFSYTFAKGSYTLKVGIGRTNGNFVGYSPAFGAYRV